MRNNFGQGPCTIDPGEMADGRGFAPVIPVIATVRTSPSGEVWVQRRVVGSDEEGAIDIFGEGGDYLGTLPPGAQMPLALLANDRVVLREVDEWDVERVTIAVIER